MKFLFAALMTFSSLSTFAAEVTITNWYLINSADSRDRAAEVCFMVKPAPTAPTHVQITVDQGTNSQGFYNTMIDQRGVTCLVVSTVRGSVLVVIPELKMETTKALLSQHADDSTL
jgi:hypothetical protein